MNAWTLRVEWPITDPAMFPDEAITVARREFPAHAEQHQATITAPPTFRVVTCGPAMSARLDGAHRAVIGEAPAVRRRNTDPLVGQYRQRRHSRGVKPYMLAQLAGVCHQGVYDVEAGKRDPRLSTLRALADALGCDLALVPMATPHGRSAREYPTHAPAGATTTERKSS